MEQNGVTITGENEKKGKFRSQVPIAKFRLEISASMTYASMSDFGSKLN